MENGDRYPVKKNCQNTDGKNNVVLMSFTIYCFAVVASGMNDILKVPVMLLVSKKYWKIRCRRWILSEHKCMGGSEGYVSGIYMCL